MINYKEFLPKSIIALTTDNTNNFSQKSSSFRLSAKQKKMLEKTVESSWNDEINIIQSHSNDVVSVNNIAEYKVTQADGIVTDLPNVPICIRTADCLPVFLFEPERSCIGLVHCGWKSTRKKIILKTIIQMVNNFHCDYRKIKVIFGPCLRSCCYEVRSDFLEYFSPIIRRDGKLFFDLCSETQRQIEGAGISKVNIFDSHLCTYCDEGYFSFRRDGEKSGRMLSLMMLRA